MENVETLGITEFNTRLAKKLQKLKKDLPATSIRQGYRGTGSQAHRRQIWLQSKEIYTDLWLDTTFVGLGGVSDLRRLPSLPHDNRTVDEMYEAILVALRIVQEHVRQNPSGRVA